MRGIIIVFLKYLIFWYIYFVIVRILFLLININLTDNLPIEEILQTFTHGAIMDFSTAGYLTVLPGILLSLSVINVKRIISILKFYTLLIIGIISFLGILDLALYPHWGTRLGITAFDYSGNVKGAFSSVSFLELLTYLSGIVALCLIVLKGYKHFFKSFKEIIKPVKWYQAVIVIILTSLLIIPIRGGLQTSPLNLSTVSFSRNLFANHAASNYLWHFANSIENHRNKNSNPCSYMDAEKSNQLFNEYAKGTNKDIPDLIKTNNAKPVNVILVVLESFSNKIIAPLGGRENICPNLNTLCSRGIIFPSFYATGNRSDKGISSLLAGYPSLLSTSAMRFPDKSKSMVKLPHYFKEHGYKTSFYYGGDIDFYNLKAFLLQSGIDHIVSQKDFSHSIGYASSWGAPDEFVYKKVIQEIKSRTAPFFDIIYTLSSHPPYDVGFKKFEGNSIEVKYLNSVAYADSCLGVFIEDLKTDGLWENTLLVITADHGALEPGPTTIIEPATYRIPLIWTGGVISETKIVDNISMQTDLLPTLIHQMGWQTDSLLFGNDIFSESQYAFYMLNDGWGFISPAGQFFYDQNQDSFQTFQNNEAYMPNFEFAKAYLQVVHDDFIKR